MENNTAPQNNTVAFEKARLIHEARESLIAADLIDERDDLDEASFSDWYDRTIPEVRDIEILAGAMKIELARRRGERIAAEDERRGGDHGNQHTGGKVAQCATLPKAVRDQRSRDHLLHKQTAAVTAYVQGEGKAKRVPSIRGATSAAKLAEAKPKPEPKAKRFEATHKRANEYDIEIIAALDQLADGMPRSDAEIKKIATITESHRFLRYVRLIPWLTIDRTNQGTVFRIDQELREICEGKRARPELEIKSIFKFLQDLRAEIKWRRDENNDKFKNPRWNSELIHRRKQSVLLDWIEEQLDRVQNL